MSSDDIKTLADMGFSEDNAEKALNITGNRGVGFALEWLLSNSEENSQPSSSADVEGEGATATAVAAAAAVAAAVRVSTDETPMALDEPEGIREDAVYRCEDCRKLFRTQLEIEYHAVKSGHSNFRESNESKKPLTEHEKKEQLRSIEEKMKQKRKEREERERKEEQEREKKRIQSGKELNVIREKMKEDELKKMIEKHKREKIEDQEARRRVKAQIEADKIARRTMFGDFSGAVATPPPPPATATISKPPQKDYAEARIQIRLTNGKTLTHTFASKEQLSAVRLFVEINRTDGSEPFSMMTTFPKKIFTEEDYDKTLDVLGLTPSAVIIVSRKV